MDFLMKAGKNIACHSVLKIISLCFTNNPYNPRCRFDPWQYLLCVRAAAMRIGAWFTEAEALEFLYSDDMLVDMEGFDMGEYKPCNEVIVCIN